MKHAMLPFNLMQITTESSEGSSLVVKNAKVQLDALVELCGRYERESDAQTKADLLKSLLALIRNQPISKLVETLERWEERLVTFDAVHIKDNEYSLEDRKPLFH